MHSGEDGAASVASQRRDDAHRRAQQRMQAGKGRKLARHRVGDVLFRIVSEHSKESNR